MFILDLATGAKETVNLIDGYRPVWSPDGTKIAIHTVRGKLSVLDHKTKQIYNLGDGESASWANNSTELIYTEVEREKEFTVVGSSIKKVNFDGTGKITLVASTEDLPTDAILTKDNKLVLAYKNGEKRGLAMKNLVNGITPSALMLKEQPMIAFGQDEVVGTILPCPLYDKSKYVYDELNSTEPTSVDEKGSIVPASYEQKIGPLDIPYLSQVYDVPAVNGCVAWGHVACAPTSSCMHLGYLKLLNPVATTRRSSGATVYYAWHVGSVFTNKAGTYTFNTVAGGNGCYNIPGGFGYMWANGSPNSAMDDFMRLNGMKTSTIAYGGWSQFVTEAANARPVELCVALGTGGHVILGFATNCMYPVSGITQATGSFLCHDPYGDCNFVYYGDDGQHSTYDWVGYNNGHSNIGTYYWSCISTPPVTDTTKPTIARCCTAANNSTSFYAYAYASDNTGVTNVKFPTWTDNAGQDDIVWHEGTKGTWTVGGQSYNWRCLVNTSNHKNEKGKYTVHVYAYDAAGNSSSAATSYTFGTPKITATPSRVTMSAEYGASTKPYVDVTIKGENLTAAMSVNSNIGVITPTKQSGWNDLTGGTLRLTLNTDYSQGAGSRAGYVAVRSGAMADSIYAKINFTVTLTEPNTPDSPDNPDTPMNDNVTSLSETWNFSQISGKTASWLTNGTQVTQDMAFKDGKLYVVHRNGGNSDNKIYIVDAYTGAKLGELPTASCTTGTYYISAIENFGGKIIACNLVTSADSQLDVYVWDNDTSDPTKLLSTTSHNGVRAGDAISVSGDMTNGKIWFGGNNASNSNVYYYTVTNGSCATTPTVISLKQSDGNAFTSTTAALNVTVESDGTFWVDAKDNVATHFKADGTFIEAISGVHAYGGDIKFITLGTKKYLAAMTYINKDPKGLSEACFKLFNITNGISSATEIGTYPSAGLGATRNSSFRNTLCYEVNSKDLNIWVLCPIQGAAYYKFNHTITTGVEDLEVDVAEQEPVYYNLQGVQVKNPENGLYIRRQGNKVTKVLIK